MALQYRDYSEWQRSLVQQELVANHKDYWLGVYEELPQALDLPLDHARPLLRSVRGSSISFKLDDDLIIGLRKLSQDTGATMYMVLLGIYNVLLGKLSNSEDIVIGTPTSGRYHIDLEGIVGMFVNTLALRNYPEGTKCFKDFLLELKQRTLASFDHELYQYEDLIDALELNRDTSRNPLFDVMFSYLKESDTSEQDFGLDISSYALDNHEVSKFDLQLLVRDEGNSLSLTFEYCIDLFTAQTIRRIIGYFKRIVASVVEKSERLIGEIIMLSGEERVALLETFNSTQRAFADKKTLLDLFAEQVAKTPKSKAVVFRNEMVTYKELDLRSNQLANYLLTLGIQKEELIPISVNRSIEMIVGVLGILKSGGAYVPINPSQPLGRTKQCLEDIQAKIIVTDALDKITYGDAIEQVILNSKEISAMAKSKPDMAVKPKDLAYIIYTSGSTGRPKGVEIVHSSVVNLIQHQIDFFGLDSSERILQFSPIYFDASVAQVWLSLLSGAALVMIGEEEILDHRLLESYLRKHSVTYLHATPSYLEELNIGEIETLRRVIAGGEVCKASVVKKFIGRYDFYNQYGPTETTITAIENKVTSSELQGSSISIGKPVANTEVYIVDKFLQLVPIGVTGELLIGGNQVARGYLNREALTKEKFIKNPFKSNDRLYRTGDLAKWLPNGNIVYVGRDDDQVKIRGYRIELGEIEYQLTFLDEIDQSVVLAKEIAPGNMQLVAYLVGVERLGTREIQNQLATSLPNYMIPAFYIWLDEIPLNSNGKISRQALPIPNITTESNYVAPTNEIEFQLVDIWTKFLGVQHIGVNDNFFELGGDSIKAIQLVSKAKSEEIYFQVKDIFKYQTIAEISKNLRSETHTLSEHGVLEGASGLLPIQKLFFEKKYANHNHYNQSVLLKLSKKIPFDTILNGVTLLLNRHDALRFYYEFSEENAIQQFYGEVPVQSLFEETASASRSIAAICDEYQRKIDIKQGELVKFVLIKTEEEANRLFVVVHHLAIDGISWRILLEELEQILEVSSTDQKALIGKKQTSYRQWHSKLLDYSRSKTIQSEYSYWKRVLSFYNNYEQDFDYPGISTINETLYSECELNQDATSSLLNKVHHAYGTEINDILLSALALTLTDWQQRQKVLITLEGHGRESLFEDIDISRTLGWFTSLYPICLNVSKDDASLESLIINTKEMLRAIPNKGIGYGVLRHLSIDENIKEKLNKNIEHVVFNYLGDFDTTIEAEGLLEFADESAGDNISKLNQRNSLLAINSMIVKGKFRMDWDYDSNRYKKETIDKLAQSYLENLNKIIVHCAQIKNKILTPYDYGLTEVFTHNELKAFKSEPHAYEVSEIYKLSPLQEGMLFHSTYGTDRSGYINQSIFDFTSTLDLDVFENSWNYLFRNHSILRTSFFTAGYLVPFQCVYTNVTVPIEALDYQSKKDVDKEVAAYIEQDYKRGFNLSVPPLMRFTIIKLPKGKTKLIMTHHHMLWDGWSRILLMHSFLKTYNALINGEELKKVKEDRYSDLISHIAAKNTIASEYYWETYLSSLDKPTYLPFVSNAAERNKLFGNVNSNLQLEESLVNKLMLYTQKHHVTLNTIVQGAWFYLLHKYTGNAAVCFGTTISGRDSNINSIENKVGLYINTIPVCTKITKKKVLAEWLKEIQIEHTLAREEHSSIPLSEIQSYANLKDLLFDSLLVFENYPVDNEALNSASTLEIEGVESIESTNYVLTILVSAKEKDISIDFSYNNTLLSPQVIKMIQGHFIALFNNMVQADDNDVLDALNYMGVEDQKMLQTFNGTAVNYEKEKTLLNLFKEQVATLPESVAVVSENETLTFRELDMYSNQLSNYLLEQGVAQGDLIPLCLDRSLAMIISILGVLKSGCAYVPIAPDYPKERIKFILEDIGTNILLTNSLLAAELEEETPFNLIYLDKKDYLKSSSSTPKIEVVPNMLAYVIYTSGTTGKPKGVMIEHAGLYNRLLWMRDELRIGSQDVILQKTTYTFDVSVWELTMPLITGSKMVFASPEGHKDVGYLQEIILKEKITLMHFVPSMLGVFLLDIDEVKCNSLRTVVCSGEALPSNMVETFQNLLKDTSLYNLYGPTEASIDVTAINLTKVDVVKEGISIGKPVANTNIYIVDSDLTLVPLGVVGELLIGGVQVARGYLNREALTKDKFIDSPFKMGERLYRTGDLARWLPSGDIAYMGRNDYQVKIRGYRIELEEIESQLTMLEGIEQALVLAKDNGSGDKQLIAYTIGKEQRYNSGELQKELLKHLPDYMVPKFYVALDVMPLTANGKADRKSLPLPDYNSADEYVAPSTDMEHQLVDIWSEVLGLDQEQISITSSFFDLGGHSLSAVLLGNKLFKLFGFEISAKEVFNDPTVQRLAEYIENRLWLEENEDSDEEVDEIII